MPSEETPLPPVRMITFSCGDECGTKVTVPATELPPGWSQFKIMNRWRCPQCVRELEAINKGTTDAV